MAPPKSMTRQAFLAHLRRSGLLTQPEWKDIKHQLPDTERGRVVARFLVEKGVITKFQAERLLFGCTDGFFLDQYVILDQIGQGGMGRVYKASHRTMNRVVALKVLAPGLMKTDRALDLFLREVRAIAQLVHPNIVTAFDANQSAGRFYLVLEYVDGPNLDQLVRRNGPLSIGQACDFVRQIAIGLQCAHSLKMVHRDIKPANILVQCRGLEGADAPALVKISDFGLARFQQPHDPEDLSGTIYTRPNTIMGTPDFLSPEQSRNLHNVDIRSDLYSLGCTFHFLLTGEVPFPGGTSMEKLIRHSVEEPTPVEQLRPETPPEVAAIVRRLMAKSPGDRSQTPRELAAALEPYSVSGPTPWQPPRPSQELLVDVPTPMAEEMANTPSPDQFLTPLVDEPLHFTSSPRWQASNDTRVKKVLLWSLALVGGLIALTALASLLGAF